MTEFEKIAKDIKKYVPTGERKWNKYFGLDKFKYLMELVNNPQDSLKFVHITGTCGKGSTAYMVASILNESGYKTGLHVSPHIYTPQERAQINGQLIPQNDFCRLYKLLIGPISLVEKRFSVPPSYYEILLAIAFLYFHEQKCDIVVVEVGLGGKLDSTNIIDSRYQIITNIGLDHMSILGNTKELILKDKQEINKPNSTVVSAIKESNLRLILKQKAKSTQSKAYFLDEDFHIKDQTEVINNQGIIVGTKFNFNLGDIKIDNIKLNMVGIFQVENAAVAIATCLQMKDNFPQINIESAKKGLEQTTIPGRWEYISSNPLTIVDGAHNPDKIRALVESIKTYYPHQKWIVIFRYKRRKDIGKSLALLASISQKIIITGSKTWGDMGWDETYSTEDKNTLRNMPAEVELDLGRAIQLALKYGDGVTPILATGSIFMIKEFKDSWQKC